MRCMYSLCVGGLLAHVHMYGMYVLNLLYICTGYTVCTACTMCAVCAVCTVLLVCPLLSAQPSANVLFLNGLDQD